MIDHPDEIEALIRARYKEVWTQYEGPITALRCCRHMTPRPERDSFRRVFLHMKKGLLAYEMQGHITVRTRKTYTTWMCALERWLSRIDGRLPLPGSAPRRRVKNDSLSTSSP
jgi:hypothetical protein